MMNYIQNDSIPEHHVKRWETMNQLREHNQMCDVAIVTNGRKFNAHKIVLSAASPYFLKMFTLAMMEADMKEIIIIEVDSETMEQVIQYIYTNKLGISSETAQNTLIAANFLQMDDLVELCGNYTVGHIDEANCFKMKELLIKSNCNDEIIAKANRYINDKFLRISRNESFLRLDINEVVELLSSSDVYCESEEDVYHSAIRWLEASSDRKRYAQQIFNCIRISLLPVILEREYFDNISIYEDDNSSNSDTLRRFKNSILVWCELESIAHIYDPSSKQWSKTLNVTENAQALIASHNDEIFLPGVEDGKIHVDVFNLREKEWTELPTPPFTNHGQIHALLIVADELYFFDYDCEVSKVYVYDIKQKVWSTQPDITADDLQLVAIDNYIYVFSTVDDDSKFQRFDTETETWIDLQPMKYAKRECSVAEFEGKIYYVGYEDRMDQSFITVHLYDPVQNEWKEVAPTKTSKMSNIKLVATIERLYAIFQDQFTFNRRNTVIVESYDVEKDEWSVESETNNVLRGVVESACAVPNCYV